MKINQTVKSLVFLFIAYLIVMVISFSTFFQTPVYEGGVLMWQSIVEQFTTWIPGTIAILFLLKTVFGVEKLKKPFFNEQ